MGLARSRCRHVVSAAADGIQQAVALRASGAGDLHPRGWAENGSIGPVGLSVEKESWAEKRVKAWVMATGLDWAPVRAEKKKREGRELGWLRFWPMASIGNSNPFRFLKHFYKL
jgi:hypothetical protein